MYIVIDTDNYFTGDYCTVGGIIPPNGESVINAEALPVETDIIKQQAYKWDAVNLIWVYDADKYATIIAAAAAAAALANSKQTIGSLYSTVSYMAMMAGVDLNV